MLMERNVLKCKLLTVAIFGLLPTCSIATDSKNINQTHIQQESSEQLAIILPRPYFMQRLLRRTRYRPPRAVRNQKELKRKKETDN